MNNSSKVMRIAKLMQAILDPSLTKDTKLLAIKYTRDEGFLTNDEAIDLVIEYTEQIKGTE